MFARRLTALLVRLAAGVLLGACWPAVAVDGNPQPFSAALIAQLRTHAQPLANDDNDYALLLASIGDARVVMLGEATHGSAEFYRQRARLSQRLIADKGFTAIVIEAGWAPTLPANAFVHGQPGHADVATALRAFRSFPGWVWRNREVAAWLDTLRASNNRMETTPAVSIYGMDLYGLPQAVASVVGYLAPRNTREAARARRDYRCFAPYIDGALDPQLYGRDLARGSMPSCAKRVETRLAQLQRMADQEADTASFAALMSARSIVGAEAYYRTLYTVGALESWNLRERFLAESLRILLTRHEKIIVWAHNTHQGDARATDQGVVGELSIGQLMREQLGDDAVYLVGMTTYSGSVRAATGWGTRDRVRRLRPAIAGSWSQLLHTVGLPAFVLVLRDGLGAQPELTERRLDRGVGVTYLPEAEVENHYVYSSLARRFDAVIHIDTTSALAPLP